MLPMLDLRPARRYTILTYWLRDRQEVRAGKGEGYQGCRVGQLSGC